MKCCADKQAREAAAPASGLGGSHLYISFLVFVSILLACVGSDMSPEASPPMSPPSEVVERINDRIYRIGNVLIDRVQGCLYIPAKVNMTEGLVELLACGKLGKRHESVLVVDAEPLHIQLALLLLGLEPGGGLAYQGDPRTPQGDSVWIWTEWSENNEWKLMRGENLVLNYVSKKPMQPTHWVFSGSEIIEGTFIASVEQSIVTTYHDPFTIIDNPLPTGADDTVYGANKDVLPEIGHKIVLIFKRNKVDPVPLHALLDSLDIKDKGVWKDEPQDTTSD